MSGCAAFVGVPDRGIGRSGSFGEGKAASVQGEWKYGRRPSLAWVGKGTSAGRRGRGTRLDGVRLRVLAGGGRARGWEEIALLW